MYAAELNPVLARRLYPRALPLGGEPTDADRRVLPTGARSNGAATTRRSESASATTPPATRRPTRPDPSNPASTP